MVNVKTLDPSARRKGDLSLIRGTGAKIFFRKMFHDLRFKVMLLAY